jgi:hypothetical protein
MSNSFSKLSTPTLSTLSLDNKPLLTFTDFKNFKIDQDDNETDVAFHNRAVDVWEDILQDSDELESEDQIDWLIHKHMIENQFEDPSKPYFVVPDCDECWCTEAIGTYGEQNIALCEDCRDEKGFCSCGDIKEECMICCDDDEDDD